MATDDVKRKLTAIFSADVVAYSRLMGEDELATVQTLTSYKETMTKLIKHYRGRVLDSIGDNLMAEFASVVDAVQCAVEVQQVLSSKNEHLPENRKMVFRIGINLGDVIEEGERIYGDGVNIAARVESLAEGGGVCISGSAFEQIENKLALGYQYMGEHTVKNIAKPLKVYRVPMGPVEGKEKKRAFRVWQKAAIAAVAVLILAGVAAALWRVYFRPSQIEPASVDRMAQPLPDKPSIAVIPFVNMSGHPEQEYFADGLTEEIITALSKVPRLFVIAKNSSFTYKGKAVKVQQVSEDLGVQYVLEGSVRKAENKVRVTAQLVDALNGRHLWAETYDRELKDIFTVQDQITFKVVAALQVKLTEGEQALIVAGRTNNFEAYAKFLQGVEYVKRFNRDGNLLARKMAEEVIDLDPNYPRGYRLLATTHWLDVRLGLSKSPTQSLAKAAELYKKVIAMDPSDAPAHAFLGMVYTMMRQHEKGIAQVEKAVALNPNVADAQAFFALISHFNGRHKEGIETIKKAIRLNPFPPNWYFGILGQAYCHAGMYQAAIAEYKKALRIEPDNLMVHQNLAISYSLLGREEEAHAEAAEVLRLNPNYCVENAAKGWPYKKESDRELILTGLRKAGLPDKPPLPLPDKPSIVVLPFVNMSGDPEQEYFSDGITEEIITALSKIQRVFVIARHSSFTYKGKPIWVPTVGKELGVRYVLEGSVRKAGDKVRLTAQLIDAKTNHHLWAERYDKDMKDIFAIQDEITQKVVTALQVKLTEGDQARIYSSGTDNLKAYLKVLKGREQMETYTKESNALARQTFEEAITLDPQYAVAYYLLGLTHWSDVVYKLTSSPKKSMAKAIELTQKSITLDDSLGEAYGFLANLYKTIDHHDKAISLAERGIALNPNSAGTYFWYGLALNYSAGNHEGAIAAFKKAIRLNPMPRLANLMWLAVACRDAGRYEEAIRICGEIHNKKPNYIFAHTCLASCYALMGREEEARREAAEVLRIYPKFSVDYIVGVAHYKNEVDRNRLRDSLLKAGLPE
ncbi:MAG: tetratricopeptide repeat protein [Desulfobacteraceae bacterium]|jgi:adenylate cyclase